jgi:glycosyltransferase involved in cell wall biosynthesis
MTIRYPSISVVTVCRNAAATIERTLLSVASSSYPSLEYVVVDGGSTDGTLDVIGRHRTHVHRLVSEPDRGISDALNKAIAMTSGEFHIIAHADDELLPGALETLGEAAAGDDAQVFCGNAVVMDGERTVRTFRAQPERLREKMSIPHMGALVRRDAWSAVGGYDLRRRIAMDHMFMLAILRRFGPGAFRKVDRTVARYALGGLSDREAAKGFAELRQNLIDSGAGRFNAYRAYVTLVMKSRLARVLGKG